MCRYRFPYLFLYFVYYSSSLVTLFRARAGTSRCCRHLDFYLLFFVHLALAISLLNATALLPFGFSLALSLLIYLPSFYSRFSIFAIFTSRVHVCPRVLPLLRRLKYITLVSRFALYVGHLGAVCAVYTLPCFCVCSLRRACSCLLNVLRFSSRFIVCVPTFAFSGWTHFERTTNIDDRCCTVVSDRGALKGDFALKSPPPSRPRHPEKQSDPYPLNQPGKSETPKPTSSYSCIRWTGWGQWTWPRTSSFPLAVQRDGKRVTDIAMTALRSVLDIQEGLSYPLLSRCNCHIAQVPVIGRIVGIKILTLILLELSVFIDKLHLDVNSVRYII